MNKLTAMLARGEISLSDIANANELIERAQLVEKALEACKKTVLFPIGVDEVCCYHYIDSAGEYEAWGVCTHDGLFTCRSNWGGDHVIGKCNLTNDDEVLIAFENREFKSDLTRFLEEQIRKVGIE